MSMAIKVSKGAYQGDPGLFSFIGSAIKSVSSILPGPLGVIGKAVGGVLSPTRPQVNVTSAPSPGIRMTAGSMPVLTARPGVGVVQAPGTIQSVSGFKAGPVLIGSQQTYAPSGFQDVTGGSSSTAVPPRGKHLNRTGYFLKGGQYVAPHSRWVTNRRRNPLNPRALSRSLSRLASAKKATQCLKQYSIREKKSCGCRG